MVTVYVRGLCYQSPEQTRHPGVYSGLLLRDGGPTDVEFAVFTPDTTIQRVQYVAALEGLLYALHHREDYEEKIVVVTDSKFVLKAFAGEKAWYHQWLDVFARRGKVMNRNGARVANADILIPLSYLVQRFEVEFQYAAGDTDEHSVAAGNLARPLMPKGAEPAQLRRGKEKKKELEKGKVTYRVLKERTKKKKEKLKGYEFPANRKWRARHAVTSDG